jgi:hypothetical protein
LETHTRNFHTNIVHSPPALPVMIAKTIAAKQLAANACTIRGELVRYADSFASQSMHNRQVSFQQSLEHFKRLQQVQHRYQISQMLSCSGYCPGGYNGRKRLAVVVASSPPASSSFNSARARASSCCMSPAASSSCKPATGSTRISAVAAVTILATAKARLDTSKGYQWTPPDTFGPRSLPGAPARTL